MRAAKLYSCLYQHCLSRPEVAELTVEDPAEAFEDLRDRNDLRYLVDQGVPNDPRFLDGVGAKSRVERSQWESDVRRKHKLAGVGTFSALVGVSAEVNCSANSTGCWRCCS